MDTAESAVEQPFRKGPLKIGLGNVVKSSEARKLRGRVGSQLKGQLKLLKLQGSKTTLFLDEADQPVFFQLDGLLIPTVYALWQEPALLPRVCIAPAVLESCMRGSSVFVPGVTHIDDAVRAQVPVALAFAPGLPCVGVGLALMSAADIRAANGGACVRPLHVLEDALFDLGNRQTPALDKPYEAPPPPPAAIAQPSTTSAVDTMTQEQQPIVAVDAPPAPEPTLTADEADELLRQAFVHALRLHVTKDQLPLLVSLFYAKYVLPECGGDKAAAALWRQSSLKRMGALVEAMRSVVVVREKGPGVLEIADVNKSSELYRKYRVDKPAPVAATAGDPPEGTVFVEELFGIPKRLRPLFETDVVGAGDLEVADRMTRREARDTFLRRVKRMDALKDGHLAMDDVLAKMLLKGGAVVAEARLPMNDALALWFEQLDKFHRVGVVGGKCLERKGVVKCIKVKEERRGGSKMVTLVEGLSDWCMDANALSQLLQKRFASSASLQDASTIVLQGARAKDVAALLRTDYRVPPYCLEVVAAAPKAKKKKP